MRAAEGRARRPWAGDRPLAASDDRSGAFGEAGDVAIVEALALARRRHAHDVARTGLPLVAHLAQPSSSEAGTAAAWLGRASGAVRTGAGVGVLVRLREDVGG